MIQIPADSHVKRKSLARRKIELWNEVLPVVELRALADQITEVLHSCIGESKRNVTVANMVAADLKRKYLVSDKKLAKLPSLIENHPDELETFLEQVLFKECQWIMKHLAQRPRSEYKVRARPESDAKRAENLRRAKKRYDDRRREYRDNLIAEQFGTRAKRARLTPYLSRGVDRSCLDKLLCGEKVPMSGTVDSFENLLGVDRHDLPKSAYERRGRRVYYGFESLLECMIHLLRNRQWLRDPSERRCVLQGVVDRARGFSPDLGNAVAKAFQPYIS